MWPKAGETRPCRSAGAGSLQSTAMRPDRQHLSFQEPVSLGRQAPGLPALDGLGIFNGTKHSLLQMFMGR